MSISKKDNLTLDLLKKEAIEFCSTMSKIEHECIIGVTDGKAVGTYVEHKFREIIMLKFHAKIGNSAHGIDFPEPSINTDVKATSIKQPQSSCPFKDATQKIYGLGYNLLLFVYRKDDKQKNNLKFLHCRFIEKEKTADFQTTKGLTEIIKRDGNTDDIKAFLMERNLPIEEITLERLANTILKNPPKIGYLTISNALQWRLQYTRAIFGKETGIVKLYDFEE
jgi:hypothetical protein